MNEQRQLQSIRSRRLPTRRRATLPLLGHHSFGSPSAKRLASIGACAYVAGFVLPFEWDYPLLTLALCGASAILFNRHKPSPSPLVPVVLIFLGAAGLAVLASADVGLSVKLSAPLLPAVLLFFVIAEHFHDTRHTRLLYITFSGVAFGLASVVLWTAGGDGWGSPGTWVKDVGSPILVVPNDGIFLSVVIPLSLVLLYREPRGAVGALAGSSVLLTVCALCVLQSRGAMLTLLLSVVCTGALLRPRLGLACIFVVLTAALLVDWSCGFPLAAKFGGIRDARLSLWLIAWSMFIDAPLLGHGARTFDLFYRPYLENLSLPSWLPVDPHYGVPWAHNLYLEVLAEQGVVGLAAFGLLLACGLKAAWKIRRAATSDERIFGAAALAGLVSFCFAATFELSFLRQWVVIVLFALLGVIAQLSNFQIKKEVA